MINDNKLVCRVESPVYPWLNIILHPVFSLPKPAQVTSVVLFNIGPRNTESNKRFIRFGHETEAEPYKDEFWVR